MHRRPRCRLAATPPLPRGSLGRFAAAVAFAGLTFCADASYACESGEVAGEVQGERGSVCAPKCREGSFECPGDVPAGTTAQPQCMLQDVNQVAYCALLCQVDGQCPSGATCKRVGTPEVSICIHPLSFMEWATGQANRLKLVVGWPSKAGQSSRGFQIARAYAALQSLKRRYGMADGDADVLTIKELLSAASVAGVSSATAALAAAGAAVPPPQAVSATPVAAGGGGNSNGALGAWKHDISYFAGNVQQGLPGMEREVHDTLWNVEHFEKRGVASELLRGVIVIIAVYVLGGGTYRYQALGARGLDMIPHVGFWMEYPNLVLDGVKYAAAVTAELFGGRPVLRGGMSGGLGDRDTFAHFEPSK